MGSPYKKLVQPTTATSMQRLIFLPFLFLLISGGCGARYGYPKESYPPGMLGKIEISGKDLSDPDLNDIHFWLYTRDGHEELFLTEESISGSPFDGSREKTVFVTHGFGSDTDAHWVTEIRTSLLEKFDFNVVCVDWRKLATAPLYFDAVAHVPVVGNQTSYLIKLLADVTGLDSGSVMMIGHSLGAHVSGFTGMYNQQTHGLTMGTIIGIDPAGPEYHTDDLDQRLDASDAEFVVVLHVNGGDLLDGCVGYADPCGHVDFYPNGGVHQPGCDDWGDIFDLISGGCSHHKSHEYVYEGIPHDQAFMAWQCDNFENFTNGACDDNTHMPMGYFTKNGGAGGQYYLKTNEESPFSVCC